MSAKDDYVDATGAKSFAANRPELAKLQRAAALDVTYTRAFGTHLYTRDLAGHEGKERAVLDCAAGAAGFFGHNHPALVGALSSALDAGRPSSLPHATRARAGAAEAKLAALLTKASGGRRWRAFLVDTFVAGAVGGGAAAVAAAGAELRIVDARSGIWSEADARDGDVIVLGDALGGGLVPAGAICVAGDAEVPFADLESHAPSELVSTLALAALELIEREDLVRTAQERGAHLAERLAEVGARHDRFVSTDVGGAGLSRTLTVWLKQMRASTRSSVLGSVGDIWPWIIEGHLLHEHGVRVSARVDVHKTQAQLTLHPPVLAGDDDIERAGAALDSTLKLFAEHDAVGILAFLAGRPRLRSTTTVRPPRPDAPREPPAPSIVVIDGFHGAGDLARCDPTFAALADDDASALLARLGPFMQRIVERFSRVTTTKGALVDAVDIRGAFHVARPMPEQLAELDELVKRVAADGYEAVALAPLAATVAAAGARSYPELKGGTDGDALALAAHIERTLHDAQQSGIYRNDLRVAVVGAASGELGALLARVLAPRLPQLLLADVAGTEARLDDVAELARGAAVDALVASTTDFAELDECNVVFLASAGPVPMLPPHVIVTDVREPIRVKLPPGNDDDAVDAARAEAMLMALAGWREPSLNVTPTPERLTRLIALAEEHGFGFHD